MFYVIFREDRIYDWNPGPWHVSSKTFETADEAQRYADSISPSREPKVLMEVSNIGD